jgi:hypothetical protein
MKNNKVKFELLSKDETVEFGSNWITLSYKVINDKKIERIMLKYKLEDTDFIMIETINKDYKAKSFQATSDGRFAIDNKYKLWIEELVPNLNFKIYNKQQAKEINIPYDEVYFEKQDLVEVLEGKYKGMVGKVLNVSEVYSIQQNRKLDNWYIVNFGNDNVKGFGTMQLELKSRF